MFYNPVDFNNNNNFKKNLRPRSFLLTNFNDLQ